MKKCLWVAILLVVVLGGRQAGAASTLNYQGRITASGTNFTGAGYFKFVLVNGDDDGIWANDGSSGSGEPASAVQVEVNNGLFNIELGNGALPGMAEIPPLLWHQYGLRLRTWFSENGTTFEQLSPDVDIRTLDFAQLDTGRAIVVDSSGKGDFEDVQEAIDCMSTNEGVDVILVAPGYYELSAPLTFPTNREIRMHGLGDRWQVNIENPSGVAAILQNCRLENLTLRGNPAVTDVGTEPDYWFECRRCVFGRSSAGGPAVELSQPGYSGYYECEIQNDQGGSALLMQGEAGINATHCDFYARAGEGHAVELDGQTEWLSLESCKLETSGNGLSLLVNGGGSGGIDLGQCTLYEGVAFSNSPCSANFEGCRISRLLFFAGDSHVNFEECRIDAQEDGERAIEIIGLYPQGNLWFRNCMLHAVSNSTFFVQDALGEIRVKDCEIHVDSGLAVEVLADSWLDPGYNVNNVQFYRCRILSYSESANYMDVVSIVNDWSREDWQAGVRLYDCEVYGHRDGIASQNSEVSLFSCVVSANRNGASCNGGKINVAHSSVDGDSIGISGTNSEIDVKWSKVNGREGGISAAGEADVRVSYSSVQGGNDDPSEGTNGCGIRFVYQGGNKGGLQVFGSQVNSSGPNPDQCQGIYTRVIATNSPSIRLFKSEISSDGPALESENSLILADNSDFYSEQRAAVLLKYTNTIASFSGCNLYGMSSGNTNAALALYGTVSVPAAKPRLWNCTIQKAVNSGSSSRYSIEVKGGATTGYVGLVNSVLSTNLDTKIGIIGVRTNLANGNYIP